MLPLERADCRKFYHPYGRISYRRESVATVVPTTLPHTPRSPSSNSPPMLPGTTVPSHSNESETTR